VTEAPASEPLPGRYAADVSLADAEARIDRARSILAAFLEGIGDAPFGLADVVARALNELEGG